MKKLHLAIATDNIAASVADYSARLGCAPVLVIAETYALWRTPALNLSLRQGAVAGQIRHLGWEDDAAEEFSTEVDVNGIVWERFAAHHQADEINALWPETHYRASPDPSLSTDQPTESTPLA